MKWIYLSPHLDDAVFSCGGLILDQTRQGHEVDIWTIFAGDPPGEDLSEFATLLHKVWNAGPNPVRERREEDLEACRIVGARAVHFPYPDCIYRHSAVDGRSLYPGREAIFGGWDPEEADLIRSLVQRFEKDIPRNAQLISPLGIGNHVDHALTRQAAQRLGRELWYYADYPYAREKTGKESLRVMRNLRDWTEKVSGVSADGLAGWQQAMAAYRSQISTFWKDEQTLFQEILDYSCSQGGLALWKRVS